MGKPPGMATQWRTLADGALRIRLQIIGTADGEEDGPLFGRQALQGFQCGSRHGLTRCGESFHGGAAQAFG